MRRNIVHMGADSLTYEIRNIVGIARRMEARGLEIIWENIGDPVRKGEDPKPWIRELAHEALDRSEAWAYSDTQGQLETREVLAHYVNARGGVKISPDDLLFFNGLGDAISTIFANLRREARVLGPSPAYSSFSSAEASHSGYEHLTYRLDPNNQWLPDLDEMRMKIQYNDTITGILLINPNNPTGAVYPREVLLEIVNIAREFDLMILCDEIYAHIVFDGKESVHISEVLGDVPGLALRGISKELPWPGSRCGWVEILNRKVDPVFDRWVKSLIDAKMLEVCSTSLPQSVIPKIYNDPRFPGHLDMRRLMYAKRAEEMMAAFKDVPGIKINVPKGAFYFTVTFAEKFLDAKKTLPAFNQGVQEVLDSILTNKLPLDQRFVYQLMAATGICVVPLSSFCCSTFGFRATLLEHDDTKRAHFLSTLRQALLDYASA